MFLEISNIKKSYGTGDSRVEILKDVNLICFMMSNL